VTIRWAEANRDVTRAVGDGYQAQLRGLVRRKLNLKCKGVGFYLPRPPSRPAAQRHQQRNRLVRAVGRRQLPGSRTAAIRSENSCFLCLTRVCRRA
jgi:hypothetical protein